MKIKKESWICPGSFPNRFWEATDYLKEKIKLVPGLPKAYNWRKIRYSCQCEVITQGLPSTSKNLCINHTFIGRDCYGIQAKDKQWRVTYISFTAEFTRLAPTTYQLFNYKDYYLGGSHQNCVQAWLLYIILVIKLKKENP